MAKFVEASRQMIEAWAQGLAESLRLPEPERYARQVAEQVGDQQAPPRIGFRHREPLVTEASRPKRRPKVRFYRARFPHECESCGTLIEPGAMAYSVPSRGRLCSECYEGP